MHNNHLTVLVVYYLAKTATAKYVTAHFDGNRLCEVELKSCHTSITKNFRSEKILCTYSCKLPQIRHGFPFNIMHKTQYVRRKTDIYWVFFSTALTLIIILLRLPE